VGAGLRVLFGEGVLKERPAGQDLAIDGNDAAGRDVAGGSDEDILGLRLRI
jgi:hypothetical protein